MSKPDALRAQLERLLAWRDAHIHFDAAVRGIPPRFRGVVPQGSEHSIWQLVEHIRRAQADILEFCSKRRYTEKRWPDDYWPASPKPPNQAAWARSLNAYRRDLKKLERLVRTQSIDLFSGVPNGDGQTYLREVLLVVDHTAYHVGQIVALRKRLGIWNSR
jgi:uncharacterized damage-inducible protein DinB